MFYGSNLLVYDFVYKIVTDIVAFNLTALQISYSRIRKSGNHGRKSQVDFFFIFYFFPLFPAFCLVFLFEGSGQVFKRLRAPAVPTAT